MPKEIDEIKKTQAALQLQINNYRGSYVKFHNLDTMVATLADLDERIVKLEKEKK